MRLASSITIAAWLSCALGASLAMAQPAPCDRCQSCESPPCGCAGHGSTCCCDGICRQTPPNPLAPGRPTPPPCCADGICYPNYSTWGHYGTRWRRWPIEIASTAPSRVPGPPPALRPDAPPYDVLPPEEEDRRAPPPSTPRGKPVEIAPSQPATEEGAEPTTPRGPAAPTRQAPATPPQESGGSDLSPESIFGLPPEETVPSTPPSLGPPLDEAPATTPLAPPAGNEPPPTTAPLGEPMGDQDLPPALPFVAPRVSNRPAHEPTVQPAEERPKANAPAEQQDDPPPMPPATLAHVSR